MRSLLAPNVEILAPEPVSISTPIEEYISILRSYLTPDQKRRVRIRVERLCKRQGLITTLRYAEVLQSHLTPLQKAGVLERLETVFSERGWSAQHVV